jgi:hypothetical protein
MSEKIKEIEEETTKTLGGFQRSDAWKQVFAKLILKECLETALYGDEFEQARENIKKCFNLDVVTK